ncbi:MAG: GNAT family N-acetyltransferase [Candidatus Andeanibacterium colombiense]|uniref:GNAT family N-acetyltransferase n=1 Tax=Candidatus Andeanibacterium colombiense TaxID=3121345 RepID=A0AAJ5X6S9_9SPHN|nr:MAG: GNAT family N-acetyltransferase [Sphingomonadaceae bacterium]
MIAVSYHDRVNVLQAMGLASAAPFDRPEWFTLLAEEGGLEPIIVGAQNSTQAAALPLMREGGALVPLANWYNFTWRALATPGADRQALLSAIATKLKDGRERLVLWPVPDEDLSASALAAAFRAAGWAVILEPCDTNHILRIAGRSYPDYLAGRPGPLRTTLKRKAKKIEVETIDRFDPKAWRDYEAVYQASWKPNEGKPAMLRRFAEQEGAAGRLRLGIARYEGRAVAAQFWTVEGGTAFIHKLAHTPESEPLSAGTVLTAALFERVIDRDKVELVDFGTGDDPYKSMWMEETRQRYRLECLRPGRPAHWVRLAKGALRKLASRGRQS